MKKLILSILITGNFLAGCKNDIQEGVMIRPVRTVSVSDSQPVSGAKFPGVSQELKTVQMAFRVAGPLVKLPVIEGQKVAKGQLLAEIDSRDFQVDLSAKEGRFIQARAEKDRYETLLTRKAVSQNEYDQKLAAFLEARSAYEAAQNALADIRLVSPFDGYIDQKFVENNQRVTIGQPIVSLLDLSSLEVKFSVPDMVSAQYRDYDHFLVTFDIYPEKQFEADLKEIEKRSVGSAGIPVTITLRHKNSPNGQYNITAGLSCNVQIMLHSDMDSEPGNKKILLPLTAVYEEEANNNKYVWVVQPDSMVVNKRYVKIGSPTGQDEISILDGVKRGETVVTAGGNLLTENQKVKFLTAPNNL